MNITNIKGYSTKISNEFTKLKASKNLEDKIVSLGSMISLIAKQNEELATQIKQTKQKN